MKDARAVDDGPSARLAVVSDVARYQASCPLLLFTRVCKAGVHRQQDTGVSPQICRSVSPSIRCATPLVLEMEDLQFGADLLFYLEMDPPGRPTGIGE